jgi:signal peptidase I
MKIKMNISQVVKENWGIIVFLLLMFASRSSVADWYVVPTGSMLPTIVEGDRIFVDKMAYRLEVPFTDIEIMKTGQPERGDIVVFNSHKADNRLVKRVIGLPGDKVSLLDNRLVINGQPLVYSDFNGSSGNEHIGGTVHKVQFVGSSEADHFEAVIVPQGHFLVLGDNRNNSADSRYIGFVPEHELQGRATNVVVSLDPENFYLPRENRNFIPLI